MIEAPASIRAVDSEGKDGDGAPVRGQFAQAMHSDVVFVEPGHQKSFTITPQTIPAPVVDVDELCRPYVADIEGRQVFGKRSAIFRELVDAGWEPLEWGGPDDPFRTSHFIPLPRTQVLRLQFRDRLRRVRKAVRRRGA